MSFKKNISDCSRSVVLTVAYVLLFTAACVPTGPHQEVIVTKNGEKNTSEGQNDSKKYVTFEDVKPIFGKFCMECHFETNKASKINWLNFEKAKAFAENGLLQREVVKTKRMPMPSKSSKDFTAKERTLIAEWIRSGSYENQASVPAEIADGGSSESDDTGSAPNTGDNTSDESNDPVEEIEEKLDLDQEKTMLVQSCTACHGDKGMSPGGAPHLAGLSKEYLFDQLKAFSGEYEDQGILPREDSETMTDMISMIEEPDPEETDEEIKEFTKIKKLEYLAEYFSRFQFTASDIEIEELDEDEQVIYERGKVLADKAACLGCHANKAIPRISGQDDYYIQSSLTAFKDETRKNEMMSSLVKRMNFEDEDIEALGLYLSRQLKVEFFDFSLLNESNVGHIYRNQCVSCHKMSLKSEGMPLLPGLSSKYITQQMNKFSRGKRHDLISAYMPMVAKTPRDQIKIIANYVAKLDACADDRVVITKMTDEDYEAGQKIARACLSCHKPDTKSGPNPRIHGQAPEYLLHSLRAFKSGERKSSLMKSQIKKLDDTQLKQVADYLSTINTCEME